jgi:membrane-bound lytic murein transglycosylase A
MLPGATDPAPKQCDLSPLRFAEMPGFLDDDHAEAFAVFRGSCAAIVENLPPLRKAIPPSPELRAICRRALAITPQTPTEARRFFEANFRPFRVEAPHSPAPAGFFTGYYEPVVDGSLTRTSAFTAPILSRPAPGAGALPDRAAIESGALRSHVRPIVWLRDRVEVFLIQVQGSARVCLPDGRALRLVYAGRNGWPYTSIGRILIDSGAIAASGMSLAALKQWIKARGQEPGEEGAALMQSNQSYVFFAAAPDLEPSAGPRGGAGLSLSPLRSLAVDRRLYPYGTPIWIDAELPWPPAQPPFRRLMIAQDTGSAIVGPARADIFFGSGDDAGARAGDVRHAGEFVVFLPVEEGSLR